MVSGKEQVIINESINHAWRQAEEEMDSGLMAIVIPKEAPEQLKELLRKSSSLMIALMRISESTQWN